MPIRSLNDLELLFRSSSEYRNLVSTRWLQRLGAIRRQSKSLFLINDLLSPTFSEIRSASFHYHTALDGMTKDSKLAKENVKTALIGLRKVHDVRPNSF